MTNIYRYNIWQPTHHKYTKRQSVRYIHLNSTSYSHKAVHPHVNRRSTNINLHTERQHQNALQLWVVHDTYCSTHTAVAVSTPTIYAERTSIRIPTFKDQQRAISTDISKAQQTAISIIPTIDAELKLQPEHEKSTPSKSGIIAASKYISRSRHPANRYIKRSAKSHQHAKYWKHNKRPSTYQQLRMNKLQP